MLFDVIIQKLLEKKSSFKKEYKKHDPHIEVSNLITAARMHKNLSQKDLARLVKTKQPSIARLESGKFLPNVSFLDKIAKALDTHLVIRFGFMEEPKVFTFVLNVLDTTTAQRSREVSKSNTPLQDSATSAVDVVSIDNNRRGLVPIS